MSGAQVFCASAPAKVNLHLGVGEARADGYHDLVTVFQAVDRREYVSLHVEQDAALATPGETVVLGMRTNFHVDAPDEEIDTPRNLAWRAVDAVVAEVLRDNPAAVAALPMVELRVEKYVFVAGGMAGGSADAAAALVAASAYVAHFTGVVVERNVLERLAAGLGADVPFSLLGGTALGTGRGDELVEMISRGRYWWLFVNPKIGISTKEAFELLDAMRHDNPALVPHLDTSELARALLATGPEQAAGQLHNDLQEAAVAMRPRLRALLEILSPLGLRAIVSGSGPTVGLLCVSEEAAQRAAAALQEQTGEYEMFIAAGPAPGAQLVGEGLR